MVSVLRIPHAMDREPFVSDVSDVFFQVGLPDSKLGDYSKLCFFIRCSKFIRSWEIIRSLFDVFTYDSML